MNPSGDYNAECTGDRLNRVAFPMGGLGVGMICLEGRGALSHVSLRNKPEVFNEPCVRRDMDQGRGCSCACARGSGAGLETVRAAGFRRRIGGFDARPAAVSRGAVPLRPHFTP